MEPNHVIQTGHFYGYLCGPAVKFCWCCALSTGVNLVATFDCLVAVAVLLSTIAPAKNQTEQEQADFNILRLLLAGIAVPFAILGMIGVKYSETKSLHAYTLFKQVELPVILVYQLLKSYFYETFQEEGALAHLLARVLVRTTVNLYFTYSVWSANMWLNRYGTFLLPFGYTVAPLRESITSRSSQAQSQVTPSASYQESGSEYFYGSLCGPGSKFCGCCSLKIGVYLVAIFDCLVSVAVVFADIGFLQADLIETEAVIDVLSGLLAWSAVPFAILGMIGVRSNDSAKLHAYSLFKRVELPVLFVYPFLLYYCFSSDDQESESTVNKDFFATVDNAVLRTALNLYFTYIVWSADVRLRRNEIGPLTSGDEALGPLMEPIVSRSSQEQWQVAPSAPNPESTE